MKIDNFLKKAYTFSNSWTGTVVIVLFIIFFIAQAFVIPSGSMKNTLLIGDHLFVKKFSYGISTPSIPWIELQVLPDSDNNGHIIEGERPKRGDIVIFKYPANPKIYYVKRCVAVGGDLVMIKNRKLYIHHNEGNSYIESNYSKDKIKAFGDRLWVENPFYEEHGGIHIDENIEYMASHQPRELFEFGPIRVPEDEFFMIGDNRDHSQDSRFIGSVPYKYIVGTPWFIYFSWDDDYNIRWNRMFRTVESIEEDYKKEEIN
jgi:signal peptidase I